MTMAFLAWNLAEKTALLDVAGPVTWSCVAAFALLNDRYLELHRTAEGRSETDAFGLCEFMLAISRRLN
jgi:hypothetical protein